MQSSQIPKPAVKREEQKIDPVQIHAALHALGYRDISVEESERLCHGPFGQAMAFLTTHLVGRHEAARVRTEIRRLWENRDALSHPTLQKIFPASTALSQRAKLESELSALKSEVRKTQASLDSLQVQAEDVAGELHDKTRSLDHDRATFQLLLALRDKQNAALTMMQELDRRVKVQLETITSQSEDVDEHALDDIYKRISSRLREETPAHGDWDGIQGDLMALLETSSPLSVLGSIQGRINSATEEVRQLAEDAEKEPVDRSSAFADHLSSLHARRINLFSYTSSQAVVADAEHRLLEAVSRSMNLALDHPLVIKTHGEMLRAAWLEADGPMREESVRKASAANDELNQMYRKLNRKTAEVQALLDNARQLQSASQRLFQQAPNLISKEIEPLSAIVEAKAQALQGFIDAQRMTVLSRPNEQPSTTEDDHFRVELCRQLRMPADSTIEAILARLKDMGLQTATTQAFLSRASFGPPGTPLDREAEALSTSQHEHVETARALLQRKIDKARHAQSIVEDVKTLVAERDAIVDGRVFGAGKEKKRRG